MKVSEVPIDVDLLLFSRWLSSQKIFHRITEENGVQVLWLEGVQHQSDSSKEERLDEEVGRSVESALGRYLKDAEFKDQVDKYSAQLTFSYRASRSALPRPKIAQAPITMLFIFIAVAIALITNFGEGGAILRAMMIVNPLGVDITTYSSQMDLLIETLNSYQLWRLISPDFLHFSVMHLVFNMLMLWFLGGQVEAVQGRGRLITLFIACSVVPNVAQYFESGPLFGGMSGVVYGLVGYCWLWGRSKPQELIMPPALMWVSVAWLAIGYTPLTEILLIGKMANSAHLFGLLMGLLVALVFSWRDPKTL